MGHRDAALLAEGLAAVAIAALGAPPVVGASLLGAIPLLRSYWDRSAATRELQKRVAGSIAAWATSEHIDDDLFAGMTIATTSMAMAGLTSDDLQSVGFDAQSATAEVIRRASRLDPDWRVSEHSAEDAAHAIARRAIHATVKGILGRDHRVEAAVTAAVRSSTAGLDGQLRGLQHLTSSVSRDVLEVADALCARGTVADLMIYLQRRIADWDESPWLGGRRSSHLEVGLTLVERGGSRRKFRPSDALNELRHIVILGEPGDGKTWLGRRFAREVAQASLDHLASGGDIHQVEIPVFTTWTAWKRELGPVRRSAIAATFSPGLGHRDLGSAAIVDRLQRLIAEAPRVLLIVDSLDEADDRTGVAERVSELESVAGWRTIVTSRPGAWDANRAVRNRDRVLELVQLAWPDEMASFVQRWFGDDSPRSGALLGRLENDTRLRAMAAVPLHLAFLCLIAESSPVASSLPLTGARLYDQVIDTLLLGDWSSAEPPQHLDAARKLLRSWAWDAAKKVNALNGLGAWADTFEPLDVPDVGAARLVDGVAPPVVDLSGTRRRTFRHRTLFEHLVASSIAQLPAQEAADVLLRHLWFDSDWQVAVPRALAMHPERDVLLDEVLERARTHSQNGAGRVADAEIDLILLDVASESMPDDWCPRNREALNRLRASFALRAPDRLVRSAQWWESNPDILDQILEAAGSGRSLPWGAQLALRALAEDFSERQRARKFLLDRLPRAGEGAVERLLDALRVLGPTEADSAAVRTALMPIIRKARPNQVASLVVRLMDFGPTPDERRDAAEAVLSQLAEDRWSTSEMLRSVALLGPSSEMCRKASRIGRGFLRAVSSVAALGVAEPLTDLVRTEADRRKLVKALVKSLRAAHDDLAGLSVELVDALDASCRMPSERSDAFKAAIATIPTAGFEVVASLVQSAGRLAQVPGDQDVLKATVLAALSGADPSCVVGVASCLSSFTLTASERRVALDSFAAALSTVSSELMPQEELSRVFPVLCLTPDERRYGVDMAVQLLTNEDAWLADAFEDFSELIGSEAECEYAVQSLVRTLETGTPHYITALDMLLGLELGQRQARAVVAAGLLVLRSTEPFERPQLISQLQQVGMVELERRESAVLLLDGLRTTDAAEVLSVVQALVGLELNASELHQARTILLHRLESADADLAGVLAEAILALSPSVRDVQSLVRWLRSLIPEPCVVTERVALQRWRELLPLEDWLSWLAQPTDCVSAGGP
jgi:Predicted NTPase (NACHT family)